EIVAARAVVREDARVDRRRHGRIARVVRADVAVVARDGSAGDAGVGLLAVRIAGLHAVALVAVVADWAEEDRTRVRLASRQSRRRVAHTVRGRRVVARRLLDDA